MSTIINNGYRLPVMDVQTLNAFVLRFKQDAEKLIALEIAKSLIDDFIELIDTFPYVDEQTFIQRFLKESTSEELEEPLSLEQLDRRIFRHLYNEKRKRYQLMRSGLEFDNELQYNCQLCIIPHEDQFLTLLFSDKLVLQTLFESYAEVSPYGYWNNTDPDENCTEKEWEKRKVDWEKALPGIGIPSHHGMVITVIDNLPSYNDLLFHGALQSIPTFEQRVKKAAQTQFIELYMQQYSRNLQESADYSTHYAAYHAAKKALQAPENQPQLTELTEKANQLLARDLNKEILKIPFSGLASWLENNKNARVN